MRATPRNSATETASTQAKDYIAAPSGAVSTADMDVGQAPARVLRSEGDSSTALDKNDFSRITDVPMDDEWLSMMAFMQENIEIRIPESTDKKTEQMFEININGKPFFFRRGENKVIPRYVADHLLHMKETAYEHREMQNEQGVKDIVYDGRTHLKYDFMIVRDPNPIGPRWYQATLAQRG